MISTAFFKGKIARTPFFKGMFYLGGAVLLTLFLQTCLSIYPPPRNAIVASERIGREFNGKTIGDVTGPFLIPIGENTGNAPGIYRFSFSLDYSYDSSDFKAPVLVFAKISGSSLSVLLNGVSLGNRGDLHSGRSSIWNSAHLFPIPPEVLQDSNIIEVQILGTYEAGIYTLPYIADRQQHSGRLFLLMLFSNYAVWLSIGALLILSLIVLGMGLFGEGDREPSILLGLAGLATAIFLTDFVYIEVLPISLVTFKRIVVSLRHLSAALFLIAYFKLLGRKLDIFAFILSGIQLLCALLLIVYPGDISEIKRLYSATYISVLPFLIYLLVIVYLSLREVKSLRFIIFGVLVSFFAATRDILVLVFFSTNGAIMISHYGFIILALSSSLFIVNDALRYYSALVMERRRVALFREEALHDELTNCYNRKILPALSETLRKPFSLIVFDLDELKSLNDKFGHATGDACLIDIVRIAKKNVRSDDWVVRTGGDEFLLVLGSCPMDAACTLAGKLVAECALSQVQIAGAGAGAEGKTATYTVSLGVTHVSGDGPVSFQELTAAHHEADEQLYRAKNSGKGRWCARR